MNQSCTKPHLTVREITKNYNMTKMGEIVISTSYQFDEDQRLQKRHVNSYNTLFLRNRGKENRNHLFSAQLLHPPFWTHQL
mmetsp:Transcript_4642/g.6038  ORF Transcript_4642/g.6038 Transcript_4642/m.6038 type:complete len:81 (-) Transcript_4642:970-1212(-)